MIYLKYKNSLEAWEKLNEMYICQDPQVMVPGQSYRLTNASFSYDMLIEVEEPKLNEDFNFGKYFHYTIGKWTKLLANYINLDALDQVKEQIRALEKDKIRTRYYNVGFHFSDDHDNGKGCLLSGVFSRVLYSDTPQLTLNLRATEVTSRLAFDMLFFQRLGEYVYGKIPFSLHIYIKQAWHDDFLGLMYHNHKSLKKVLKNCEDEKRKAKVMKILEAMLNGVEADYIKYMGHFRVFKTLRKDLYPRPNKKLLAEDCIIGNWDGIPLPKECPDVTTRNLIKQQLLKLKDKFGIDLSKGTQDEEGVNKLQKIVKFK